MTPSGPTATKRARSGRYRRATRGATTILSAACLAVGLSGCGNWIEVHHAGLTGLTVDKAGQPVIAVMTCSKATPMIDMAEGMKKADAGKVPNVERGRWVARHAYSGVQLLAVNAPGKSWKTTRSPGVLEPGTLFIFDGGTREDDVASLGGVFFRLNDLAALSPDEVQVNGKPMSWARFAAYDCKDMPG
jgi:hypothetical protein